MKYFLKILLLLSFSLSQGQAIKETKKITEVSEAERARLLELNRKQWGENNSSQSNESEDSDIDVPFAVIEEVPVFPGCENAADKRACFNEKMQEHIRVNFRYPEIAQEMGIQGRVSVLFTIQKDGSIGNIRMRGPDRNLEVEAQRIISKLPRMLPGKQRGKAVRVPFSTQVTFKLQ